VNPLRFCLLKTRSASSKLQTSPLESCLLNSCLNLMVLASETHGQKVARSCLRTRDNHAKFLVAKAENQPVCVLEFVKEWFAPGSVWAYQAKVKPLL